MLVYGEGADAQQPGDLLVRETVRDEAEDLDLARREGTLRVRARSRRRAFEVGESELGLPFNCGDREFSLLGVEGLALLTKQLSDVVNELKPIS